MRIVPEQAGLETPATKELALNNLDLHSLPDPWERARLANQLAEVLQRLVAGVLGVRREAVRELVDEHDASHTLVALHLGVSRARVTQLAGRQLRTAAENNMTEVAA